jgi:hypothetical protein
MSNKGYFPFATLASVFVAAIVSPYGQSQTGSQRVSDTEKAICAKYNLVDKNQDPNQVCIALSNEFKAKRAAAGLAPIGLNPLDDLGMFVQERAAAAYASVLVGELKSKAEALALQAVSTRAAVNQAGAASSSGTGSTNLVSKPTTTDLISVASESGAFTDTLNGTSATLQANAAGLAKLFTKHPIFSMDAPSYAAALQPLNLTVTLNVAQQGGTTTVPTSGGSDITSVLLPSNNASFSSFQARYNIYRPNDPTSASFHAKFLAALTSNQAALDSATSDLARVVQNLVPKVEQGSDFITARSIWTASAARAEGAQPDFEALIGAFLAFKRDGLAALEKDPGFQSDVLALANGLNRIQDVINTAVNTARGTALATLTYTYATPTQQPSTNQFGVVASYLFKGGHQIVDPTSKKKVNDGTRTFLSGVQFSGNFQATLFVTTPDIVKNGTLRDLQVSAEFDKPFGGTTDNPRATWSLAGYGQYQYDPSVLNINAGNLVPGTPITLPSNAQVLLGSAGWLGVGQGKLVFNLNKGLSIPVALKWSNKTQLLDSKDIRGQFGISYDLSALSSLLSKGN